MKKLMFLALFLGFALPSFSQAFYHEDTVKIKGETFLIEKRPYVYATEGSVFKDTVTVLTKTVEEGFFSVKVLNEEIIYLFVKIEDGVYMVFNTDVVGTPEYEIIYGGDNWSSRDATQKEKKQIKKEVRQTKRKYLQGIS